MTAPTVAAPAVAAPAVAAPAVSAPAVDPVVTDWSLVAIAGSDQRGNHQPRHNPNYLYLNHIDIFVASHS